MANEFKVRKGLIVEGSGSAVLDVQGTQGQLFSVTDDLTGDIFSVSDISGVPILNVNADGTTTIDGTLTLTNDAVLDSTSDTSIKFLTRDSNGVVKYHTLGSNAFNSTSFATGDNFDADGTFASLRAQGTTKGDVGLGSVTNESKSTMFASPTFTGTVAGVTATHVGLGNVTNESKSTMFASPTFTGTVAGVTKSHVGLGNVTNQSKSTMFSSPTFTGAVSASADGIRSEGTIRSGDAVHGMESILSRDITVGRLLLFDNVPQNDTSEATSLMITTSGGVVSRELGSNAFNSTSIPAAPNNATITITAGNALTTGGNFTTNQSSNETITIHHQDTSTQASVNNSNNTVIQDVTLDTYGHVTGLASKTISIPSSASDLDGYDEINLSSLNNDTGFTTNSGTVTNVQAGNGISVSSGTTTPTVTAAPEARTNTTGDLLINVNGVSRANYWEINSGLYLQARTDSSGGPRFRSGTGTYSTPSISFKSDTNTGFWGGTDQINASCGGSHRFQLAESGLKVVSGALGVNVTPSSTNGRIDASNDILAYSSSDRRWKENIKPIENALSKILKIGGYEFDWKELTEEERKTQHGNEGHDVGVIAQEVEEVLPEVVTTRENGFKGVKYDKMVALLIEGMKEQQSQIEELKSEIKKLKGEI